MNTKGVANGCALFFAERYWVLGIVVLGNGLDAGYLILDARYWVLSDTRYRVLQYL